MQYSDKPSLKIVARPKGIVHLTEVRAVKPHGQGVYGEVAPAQVIIDSAGTDTRQLGRQPVFLAARRYEVYVIGSHHGRPRFLISACEQMRSREGPLGGSESGMGGDVAPKLGSQRPCQSNRISFDKEIQIGNGSAKNGISQRTAYNVDGHPQGYGLSSDREKKLQRVRRQPLSQQNAEIGLHCVIVTDEIVYNPVDVSPPSAVPAWLKPYLVWIGFVLRIQRGSRTR
jgi:hypothetical protein